MSDVWVATYFDTAKLHSVGHSLCSDFDYTQYIFKSDNKEIKSEQQIPAS